MKWILIEGEAKVSRFGSACMGMMAWETPYIDFLIKGEKLRWFGDLRAEHFRKNFSIGDHLSIRGFKRYSDDDTLRRLTWTGGKS